MYITYYRNLPIKRPRALEIHGQKRAGVGVYMEKPFVRITHIHTDHRSIKKRGWALIRENMVLAYMYWLYSEIASDAISLVSSDVKPACNAQRKPGTLPVQLLLDCLLTYGIWYSILCVFPSV